MTNPKHDWTQSLSGLDAPTPLWRDRAPGRAVDPDAPRRHVARRLGGDQDLARLLREQEIEPAAAGCGAWALLLGRTCREQLVVFGALEAGDVARPRCVPVRLEGSRAAGDWLQGIQREIRDRAEAGPVELDQLQRWAGLPEGAPLLESVVFIGDHEQARAAGVTGAWPLVVGLVPGTAAQLWVDGEASRFDEWTLQRLLEHLATALAGIGADPAARVQEITLLSPDERERLLVEWNQTAVGHRPEATIAELFAEQVTARPDAAAVLSDGGSLSYRELDARSSQLARHLQQLGIQPDTPVALSFDRTPESIVALLGIVKAGGAYLPIDPAYPADRLSFLLQDAGASILLTQQSYAEHFAGAPVTTLAFEALSAELDREPATAPQSAATASNLAYIAYTSGSTGEPKGAQICQRAVNRLVRQVDYVQLGPDEIILHAAPLAFDASTFEVWGALLNGGACALYSDPVPTARGLAQIIERHGVTTLWLTAALFNTIIDEDPSCLRGARQLLTGGEALSVVHVRRALAALPQTRLFNGYGPTECTTFTTVYPIPRDLDASASSVPIGRPIRDTQVYIVDENLQPQPEGVIGELLVGGAGLARGYLGRPRLTAQRFVESPFGARGERLYRTGDLVFWRPDRAVEFVGRVDHQVKIRGFRIEPGEIEVALGQHPAVQSVVVIQREDLPGTRRLVAYLVARDPEGQVRSAELRQHLASSLPEYMIPSVFVWLDALPINQNGKVDRRQLPAPASERPDLDVEFVAASSDTERRLVQVLESLLGTTGVGIRDNFFDLGGNSLLALRVIARVRDELGAELPVVRFFQRPTVEALAALIEAGASPEAAGGAASRGVRQRPLTGALDDVAIIGMQGRFPGARDVRQLWDNLVQGKESITYFQPGDLDPSLPADLTGNADYVPARGIVQDVELFDAAFFGISPREAEVMDPQQRLFIEVAWETLEGAGYVPGEYPGQVGVFGGMNNATYYQKHLTTRPDLVKRVGEFQVMVANEKDYVATRTAHKLNLTGPAVSVHTACSTSLVAVAVAFHSLRTHQCDMALAGGSSITCPPKSGYLYQEGAMLSPDGHTRSFDARAQGTVFSDGVSMLLLKRLADAERDGDTIFGVLKGAAINNDGADKASFTAPSVDGQVAVIREAQAVAGVDPRSISYVETHGTATPLGDPIEFEALRQAFGPHGADRGYCALGSVKSNFGHLVYAAGGVGLIKTALALQHQTIPPTLHFESPNPTLGLEDSPFFVNNEPLRWEAGPEPRRAGVSSFGVGGTNAHVVLQEAPPQRPSGPSRGHKLLLLSARTETALAAACERLRDHLQANPEQDLADVAYTLMVGRRAFKNRRALVASDAAEALELLQNLPSTRVFTRTLGSKAPEVAFMFPGQGAQYVRMGQALYRQDPTYRSMVDYCAEVLRPTLGFDLRELVFAPAEDSEAASASLKRTEITQPALFVTEYALAQLWISWGVQPAAMIGHSVGEFVAAAIAGVMPLDDALRLVALRGRLMGQQPEGAMLSVRLASEDVAQYLDDHVCVASDNGPGLCVLAGPHLSVAELEQELTAAGVACRPLLTSHAFHSPMMDDVIQPFAEQVQKVPLGEPKIPFVSTVSGTWIRPDEATDPQYWAQHLRQTVRFRQGVATLLEDPDRALLEVGPRASLATLARQQARGRTQPILPCLGRGEEGDAEWTALLGAAGQLWLAGVPLSFEGLHVHEQRRRVTLPTYPFERKRFWVDPAVPALASAQPVADVSPLAPTSLSASPDTPPEIQPAGGDNSGVDPVSNNISERKSQLLAQLMELFEEVSGFELPEDDPAVTFLELGLDSLTLTQVAQELQSTFQVKVTFRQLMEDFPSLELLLGFLEQNVPDELFPEQEAAAAQPAAAAPPQMQAPVATAGGAPAGFFPAAPGQPVPGMPAPMALPGVPDMQSMWIMQQMVQQQVAMYMTAMQQAGALPFPQAVPAAPVAAPAPAPAAAPATQKAAAPKQPRKAAASKPKKAASKKEFGAIARIRTEGDVLTDRQQARLDAFVRRYNDRTRSSKEFTQRHRGTHADPRAVTGFRPAIKEIVYPIVASRSKGPHIWDLDGNRYIDVLNGFGCNYFGWQPDFVNEAVKKQIDEGIEIGPQTPLAAEVADLFCEYTGNDRAAFCNTGSEAVMGCMRIARTVTGRSKIAIFTGSYHGIFDEVIVRATRNLKAYPAAPGILPNTAGNVLVLDYGTPESLEILRQHADELAAVLVEPVQSRRPDFQPREFLHEVRKITADSGAVFIFDEVITGFRTGPRGAQGFFDIQADLGSYGKVVAGGYPMGVIAGKKEYMDALDGGPWQFGDDSIPTVGVTYFAGTFVRHPLALAATRAVLQRLKQEGPGLQEQMNARTADLAARLNQQFKELEAPLEVKQFSTLWKAVYTQERTFGDLLFFMLRDRGIHIYDGFPCFHTTSHGDQEIEAIVTAFRESVIEMQEAGFLPEPAQKKPDLDAATPPVPGARLGRDANGEPAWFVPNPDQPGKFQKVV